MELRFERVESDHRAFRCSNMSEAHPYLHGGMYDQMKRDRHRAMMDVVGWCEEQFGISHSYMTWRFSMKTGFVFYDEAMCVMFRLRWSG